MSEPTRAALCPVAIVGMMGTGKTTVGRLVAERLDLPWRDTDQMVETRTGQSIDRLFATVGEEGFRDLESDALADALAVGGVVSCGGGVVLRARNRAMLTEQAGLCVWLRARPAVLAERVGPDTGRPLLVDDARVVLTRLATERRPHFEAVAGVTVDVDDLSVEQVVARVVAAAGTPGAAR